MVILRFAACLLLAAVAGGCASTDGQAAAPRSVQLVCSAGGPVVDCFRPASDLCGRQGYDLFDRHGRRATVADAAYGPLVARCRER